MKAVGDVINILMKVRNGILKFYIEDIYIYCENTKTRERVVVGAAKCDCVKRANRYKSNFDELEKWLKERN